MFDTANRLVMSCFLPIALALGACSSTSNSPGADKEIEASESELGAVHITVRNRSNRVRYLTDSDAWIGSLSAPVQNFYLGGPATADDLFLRTNQPSCDQIESGELSCRSHGDRGLVTLLLEPGAEFDVEWIPRVWRATEAPDRPGCTCMEEVAAPSTTYEVRVGVGSELTCGPTCTCEPADGTCTVTEGSIAMIEDELEATLVLPNEREVTFELE